MYKTLFPSDLQLGNTQFSSLPIRSFCFPTTKSGVLLSVDHQQQTRKNGAKKAGQPAVLHETEQLNRFYHSSSKCICIVCGRDFFHEFVWNRVPWFANIDSIVTTIDSFCLHKRYSVNGESWNRIFRRRNISTPIDGRVSACVK